MMSRVRGAQLGAIAITAGAIAVAGCSSSSPNNSASGKASSSASASASSGGASSGGASLTAAQAVKEAAQHAQKATSYAADITVKTSGTASSTISGSLKQQTTPSPLAVADFSSVTVQGQQVPGGMEEIINSGGIYLKLSELSKQTGKPWIKIPSSDVSKLGGASLSQLLQNGSNDPLTQTQMLSSSTNVKKVGTATINGVATTEYTGTYPITAGLAKLPAAARSKIASQLQAMGLTTEHFTVWLDGQQQVRKVVSSARGTSEQVASTVTVTSVNQPVTATLPPASQTATVPSGELGGSGTGTTTS
jgi:hypothetical protein